jgi:hypothetical protein
MKENENEIIIQFANTIKSLLMSLWYPNQIKIKIHYFIKNTKMRMTSIK